MVYVHILIRWNIWERQPGQVHIYIYIYDYNFYNLSRVRVKSTNRHSGHCTTQIDIVSIHPFLLAGRPALAVASGKGAGGRGFMITSGAARAFDHHQGLLLAYCYFFISMIIYHVQLHQVVRRNLVRGLHLPSKKKTQCLD